MRYKEEKQESELKVRLFGLNLAALIVLCVIIHVGLAR